MPNELIDWLDKNDPIAREAVGDMTANHMRLYLNHRYGAQVKGKDPVGQTLGVFVQAGQRWLGKLELPDA